MGPEDACVERTRFQACRYQAVGIAGSQVINWNTNDQVSRRSGSTTTLPELANAWSDN